MLMFVGLFSSLHALEPIACGVAKVLPVDGATSLVPSGFGSDVAMVVGVNIQHKDTLPGIGGSRIESNKKMSKEFVKLTVPGISGGYGTTMGWGEGADS